MQKRNIHMKFTEYLDLLLSRRKVSNQLIIIFILALVLPITFISFVLLYDSQKSLSRHYKEQTYSDNLRVKSILFDVTTNAYNISEDLVMDAQLIHLLNSSFSSDKRMQIKIDSYQGFHDVLEKDTSIRSIEIYTLNREIGTYSNFTYADANIRSKDWFLKAQKSASGFWTSLPYTDKGGNISYDLTLFRKIILVQSKSFAVIAIRIDNNYLRNRIYNNTLSSIVTVNQDPVFYSSEKSYRGLSLPTPINYDITYYETTGTFSINHSKVIGTISTLLPYRTDDQIYVTSFNSTAIDEISQIQGGYILIILILIGILVLLFYLFSNYFSRRVSVLRTAMRQASHGYYNIIDSFSGKDEFYEIFHDLKTIITDIKAKEALIYENQLKKQQLENQQQQMEFKMLASQINPHFLYNTLETIRMKAFTSGNREVATAIKLLGKSLRYVLDNTGTVSTSLSKEIEHIRTYVQIQKLRFGERVNYFETIDPDIDLDEYRILPLLLQPIVENAISHGLEGADDKKGQIEMKIYKDETYLHISISDNGIGMTKDELYNLKQKIMTKDDTKTRSIGLYNINQRISLCYGPKCHLNISSILGEKTTVSLQLPLDKIGR